MNNTLGTKIKLTIKGASHDPKIIATLKGLPSGLKLDFDFIKNQLAARRPSYAFNSPRIEKDNFIITSGLTEQLTNSDPLIIEITNSNYQTKDYPELMIRPSHADYVSLMKYGKIATGGGIFSGRMSVGIVAIGAVCQAILREKDIYIGSHIHRCLNYQDSFDEKDLLELILKNTSESFVVYNPKVKEDMITALNKLSLEKDSTSAIIETFILNLPDKIGDPYFNSLESIISHAIFSIGGVKGIEFGLGFDFINKKGSEVNDTFYYNDKQEVKTRTNHNGGINGGISNGMPISFKTIIKPTSSIGIEQESIDIINKTNVPLTIKGRHDAFFANRALIVINNLLAFVMLDAIIKEYGREWLI